MIPNEQAAAVDSDPQREASIDELMRMNHAFQSRVCELTATNDGLRSQMARDARRLQTIMSELALAAERVGDRPLAGVIRAVAAAPSDLSSVAACGRGEAKGCALHGEQGCAHCRALGPVQRLISAREREVLRLLTEGSRSPCIAAHLGISIATVEVHRRNIMRKLNLHSVAALTKYAVREGLTAF